MDKSSRRLESAKNALATAASIAASAMVARSIMDQYLPFEIRDCISFVKNSLWPRLSSEHTIVIAEQEDYYRNQLYDSVNAYLATVISTSLPRVRVSRVDHDNQSKQMTLSIEPGVELTDKFEGVEYKWSFRSCKEVKSDEDPDSTRYTQQVSSYELTFNNKYKDKVLTSYLPYIEDTAKEMKLLNRKLKLHTNDGEYWRSVDFCHPVTFDTLVMDSELKQLLMDDLKRFTKRKDYYKKIGKAWKRGYLLYGPPGTGKSSLVAAMANFLKFDVYDLELTGVEDNNGLKRCLLGTTNRSIIVVEDIDCSVEVKERDENSAQYDNSSGERAEKLTLSGLLNFADGLWSSCGEERIMVFTTNYKDRIDQALLRPGRMDMHIHMGYCSMSAVRMLAMNYHSIDDHVLYEEIEELIKEVEITPAEVAEEFMRSEDKEIVLRSLIELMEEKKKVEGIKSLSFTADGLGAVFDVPADVSLFIGGLKNSSDMSLETIEKLPPLQEREESRFGGGGRGGGGRGGFGGGVRGRGGGGRGRRF